MFKSFSSNGWWQPVQASDEIYAAALPSLDDLVPFEGGTECSESSDCAVGWRCIGGACAPPQNTPGSNTTNEGVDAGCGSTGGGGSYGGGCGGVGVNPCTSPTPGGNGCGGSGGGSSADNCCGGEKCCRRGFDGVLNCECGPCYDEEEEEGGGSGKRCNKFCSDAAAATGALPGGCSQDFVCDECEDCALQGFVDHVQQYACQAKSAGAPCHCNNSICGTGSYCNGSTGSCVTVTTNPAAEPGGQEPGAQPPIPGTPDNPELDPDPQGTRPSLETEGPGGGEPVGCHISDCPSCFSCGIDGNCELTLICTNFYFYKIVTFTYTKKSAGHLGCNHAYPCLERCTRLRSTIAAFGGLLDGGATAAAGGGLYEGPQPDDPSWSLKQGTTHQTSVTCNTDDCEPIPCISSGQYTTWSVVRADGSSALSPGEADGRPAFTGGPYTQRTPFSCTKVTYEEEGYQEYTGYGVSVGEAYADAAAQAFAPYNSLC